VALLILTFFRKMIAKILRFFESNKRDSSFCQKYLCFLIMFNWTAYVSKYHIFLIFHFRIRFYLAIKRQIIDHQIASKLFSVWVGEKAAWACGKLVAISSRLPYIAFSPRNPPDSPPPHHPSNSVCVQFGDDDDII